MLRRGVQLLAAALVFLSAPLAAGHVQDGSVPPGAAAPVAHARHWGLMAARAGTSWQFMSSQIVSYRWDVPGESLLEVDEGNGNVARWTRQDDGTLLRVNHRGGRAVSVVNPDGTMLQTSGSGTQRQTMRPVGRVVFNEFELLENGQWRRFPPYDWIAWRMTDEQLRIAREVFASSTDVAGDARELLARFRGSTAVEQNDARMDIHEEALRRQQAASAASGDPGEPAARDEPATGPETVRTADAAATRAPRIALVVGISNYGPMGSLPNPVNDARALSERLSRIGFDVELAMDPDQRELRAAIQRLGGRMADAGRAATVLFFFAGHGIQSRGENYLIPAGANIVREADLELEAVSASVILRQMEEVEASTNIMILDACRNMPLTRSFRSGGVGLTQMDAPNGSFIAYSTAPGSGAADGAGANSPFAAALLQEIARPGQPIEAVFRNVRRSVLESTGGEQTPWDSSSLIDAFFFMPEG